MHGDANLAVDHARPHGDRGTLRGELDCVAEEVADDAHHLGRIGGDGRQIAPHVGRDHDVLLGCQGAERFARFRDDGCRARLARIDREVHRLHAGHIEQVFNEMIDLTGGTLKYVE